jgi:hypothetical protein
VLSVGQRSVVPVVGVWKTSTEVMSPSRSCQTQRTWTVLVSIPDLLSARPNTITDWLAARNAVGVSSRVFQTLVTSRA